MTISSSTGASSAAVQSRPAPKGPPPSGGKPPAGGPPPNGGPNSDEMKAALEKLKSSNPELAEKMQKIGERMESLKNEGVSMEEAHKTVEAEFGKPTDDEMSQLGAALGRPARKNASSSATPLSSGDVSQLISSQTQNTDILKLLEEREAAAA